MRVCGTKNPDVGRIVTLAPGAISKLRQHRAAATSYDKRDFV
jgi:hypothetical protein